MKRGIYVVMCLLLVAGVLGAEELYTKTYKDGQTFEFLNHEYLVELVVDNKTHIRGEEYGQILEIDDCVDLREGYFCVDDSENGSTEITFWERIFNISIDRTYFSTMNVSDVYRFQIVLTNYYDRSRFIELTEETNLTIVDEENFPGLFWAGRVSPNEQKLFKYLVRADTEGEYFVKASANSENTLTLQEEEIDANDFVSYSTTHEENPVRNQEYNYTVTYTVSGSGTAQSTINVTVPQGANITDKGNFTRVSNRQIRLETNDTSEKLWFTYLVEDRITDHIVIDHKIIRSNKTTFRKHLETLTSAGFERIFLVHNYNDMQFTTNETVDLTVQLFNPNEDAIVVDLEITSYLYNKTQTLTIPASNASEINIRTTPRRAGEYGIVFHLEYDDENGDDVEHTGAVRLNVLDNATRSTVRVGNTTNTTIASVEEFNELEYPKQAVLILQPAVYEDEEHYVRVELVGYEGELVNISVFQDDIEIHSEQRSVFLLTDTLRINTIGPGAFTATISTGDGSLTTTRKIEKQEGSAVAMPVEETVRGSFPWVWLVTMMVLVAIGAVTYLRKR